MAGNFAYFSLFRFSVPCVTRNLAHFCPSRLSTKVASCLGLRNLVWKRHGDNQKIHTKQTKVMNMWASMGLSCDDDRFYPTLACGALPAGPRFPCNWNTCWMKGMASERSASSRILRMWVALNHGQRIGVVLISEDERSVGIGFVCELDQRYRVGGCTERRRSSKGNFNSTGLGCWR